MANPGSVTYTRVTMKHEPIDGSGRVRLPLLLGVLSVLLLVLLAVGCSAKADTGEQTSAGGTQAGQPEAAGEQSAADEVAPTEAAAPATAARSPAGASTEVSFRAQVAPIFAAKCVFCHHPDNAVKTDLTRPFDPEVGLVNRPNSWTRSEKQILVVPGDPEASALMLKVERTDLEPKVDGDLMPWNIPRLTSQELNNLRRWIAKGAKDDAFYRSNIARLFGDGVSLGSRGGKCAYCHYPGAAFGPDLTDPFDPERGAVELPSAYGDVRVVPGDPDASLLFAKVIAVQLPPALGWPMPLHFQRLSESERQTLRDWIAQGAKDN